MNKAVYIHGLGGSGNGSSAANVRKALVSEYEFSASTYDLLKPKESLERIKKDVEGADLVIASSLGGFYASVLDGENKIILLNPCLMPDIVIESILYDEQKVLFDKDKCVSEWKEMRAEWKEKHSNVKFAGIFADKDELFHFQEVFDKNFKSMHYGDSAMISGTHEIAKDTKQLHDALEAADKIFKSLA